MDSDKSLDQYFKAARAWEEDRWISAQRSERRAWAISAACCFIGLCGLGTAAALAPMKTVVPYFLRVDSSTGVVDAVSPMQIGAPQSEVITRHLLHLFVTAKERYIPDLAPSDYALVGSMQSAVLNQQLLHDWDKSNPESPINRYRDGTVVLVKIHSITFLPHDPSGNTIAQVRFSTIHRSASGGERASQWITTLAYRYTAKPKELWDVENNPLSLLVSEYQREPEVAMASPTEVGS